MPRTKRNCLKSTITETSAKTDNFNKLTQINTESFIPESDDKFSMNTTRDLIKSKHNEYSQETSCFNNLKGNRSSKVNNEHSDKPIFDKENTFRILLTTDTHLGHKEKDNVRGNDSFDTFEEILKISNHLQVDFMVHGGDLFDEHKPSRKTMYNALSLIKKYTMGDGPINFEILNDISSNLRNGLNYSNPNLNVQLPIFAIHGNHDDPGEEAFLSALDVVEAAGLINYFGRADNLDDIQVEPILMKKGTTKFALYGLGWIRDERLHHIFNSNKVKFVVSEEFETSKWFNFMMIHQNRYKGAAGGAPRKNCVHESMLPSFFDLVLWGHEHDCFPTPQESIRSNYDIIQLGSSVQTSLSGAEALPKHIVLLEVNNGHYRTTSIPLYTTRPFYFYELNLTQLNLKSSSESEIWEVLTNKIEEIIDRSHIESKKIDLGKAAEFLDESSIVQIKKQILEKCKLPLIRLRVDYTNSSTINTTRFGVQFTNRVANPSELLQFYKKKKSEGKVTKIGLPNLVIEDSIEDNCSNLHDIIFNLLDDQNTLDLIPEPDMNIAVQDYVIKMDHQAISNFVKKAIDEAKDEISKEVQKLDDDAQDQSKIVELLRRRTESMRNSRLEISQLDNSRDLLEAKETELEAHFVHDSDAHSSSENDIFSIMTPKSEKGAQIASSLRSKSHKQSPVISPPKLAETSGKFNKHHESNLYGDSENTPALSEEDEIESEPDFVNNSRSKTITKSRTGKTEPIRKSTPATKKQRSTRNSNPPQLQSLFNHFLNK